MCFKAEGDHQSSKAESEPKEVKEETAEKEEKDLEENGEGWLSFKFFNL